MKNKKKALVGITGVVVAFIAFHYVGWLNPIEDFVRSILNPLVSRAYSLRTRATDFNDKSEADWKQTYQETACQILKDENQQLKRQLNFADENNYQIVGARVIGRNLDPLGSVLIINRGSEDGLALNQPAIVGGGVLVGIVSDVSEKTATVRLINDGQSKIAATLLNKDKSIGLVEGGFGISVRMNMIPQNESLAIDDLVITSGLSATIPRGLIIGIVEAIERESYQPFQRATITPAATLDKILDVSVLTGINYEGN